ncbi:hypothetical protein [Pedobacter psychrodurus]|uniref:hypothetical protein n=1 Tax=Pedobacter psychrodurus TaxID=2530456 RepID=UPI00292E73FE|nr:hypothetical protein [Pedobacter psychrodurus]
MKTKDLQHQSDTELLENICRNDANDVSYSSFVSRYIKDVETECSKICERRKLDKHIGLQIAHDTFEKVKKYRSFDRNKLRGSTERLAIMGFLYRIYINLFKDYHNKNNKTWVKSSSYFEDLQETLKFDVRKNHQIKEYTLRILKKLNEKEKKVLIADIEYKRNHKYLPDDVVASLCLELNIKEPAIRKLRERLIFKIKKEIDIINGEQ